MTPDLHSLVRPSWSPLRHVERGWAALEPDERALVTRRVEGVLAAGPFSPRASRSAMAAFFAFLAQVETIAIEIPLRFLPTAPEHLRPYLRRQLTDEVFHSCLFARLAHELAAPAAQPAPPIPAAEDLLQLIRKEEDLAVSATLLNLVAEGWIEGIFKHAVTWGVADPVFAAVLEDEERHVEEAHVYQGNLDRAKARAALDGLEEGLLRLGAEPSVALALLELAGEDGYRAMVVDLVRSHRAHLAEIGLAPGAAWQEREKALDEALAVEVLPARATPVPDTPWRALARRTWSTPRDPAMRGDFDLPVGHIPKRELTATLVAAIGRVWAAHPELNRVVAKGRVWQLPALNVGVRVAVAEGELATVVVTEADRRSVRDVSRLIAEGARRLKEAAEARPRDTPPFDPEVFGEIEPGEFTYSVAVSNSGRYGLIAGSGALSGTFSPSSDITIGERRRAPKWYGVAYLPAWHVNLGCVQDHRVFDGRDAGVAMRALSAQMSPRGYKALRAAPDSLGSDGPSAFVPGIPADLRALGSVGFVKSLPVAVAGGVTAAAAGAGAYYLIHYLQRRREEERRPPAAPEDEGPGQAP